MRALTIFFIFVLLSCSHHAFSQVDTTFKKGRIFNGIRRDYGLSNDTVIKKGIKFRVTNFAVQLNAGASVYFNDNETKKYFDNYWSQTANAFFYYKNYFYGATLSPGTVKMKDTLNVVIETLYKNESLELFNSNVFVGYNVNLPHNISILPYAELISTDFSSERNSYIAQTLGYGFGFFINKYINLQPRRYLIIFLNSSINHPYYNDFNSSLGNSYYSISFGVGYKAWFLRKIKE